MGTLKWIGYTIASLVVLSGVLGGGVFILFLAVIFGICFSLVALVGFVAFCIKEYFEPD